MHHNGFGGKHWCLLMCKQGIGDVVSSLPAIDKKIKDGFTITVRGREFYKPIYERMGCIYEVVPEFAIEFGELGWLDKNLKRFGRIYSLNEWSLSHIRKTKDHTINYIDLLAEILEVELGEYDFNDYLPFEKTNEDYIVFAPYATSSFRSYPWAPQLFEKLSKDHTVKVIDAIERIPGSIKCKTFDELVSIIGNAKHVVSVDTGVLHIACALGVPVSGLFGSTDGSVIMGAYKTPGKVFRTGDCPPCHEVAGNFNITHRLCKGKNQHAECMMRPAQIQI